MQRLGQGGISVGGVPIDSTGLHQLRGCMSVIPQDSFVFSGTLRFNIDPFEKHSDSQILRILSKIRFFDTMVGEPVSAGEIILKNGTQNIQDASLDATRFRTRESLNLLQAEESAPGRAQQLEFQIEDGGANLSVGQKQLICIARALIKKPWILLMDEATSNIDEYTDSIIQGVIRGEFQDTTIGKRRDLTPVTIAHRLKTVMYYDRIFVLDDGKLIQSGTPRQLLTDQGPFREMVGDKLEELSQAIPSIR